MQDTKEAIRLAQQHPPSSPFEQHLTALAFAHDSQFETALIKAQHALRWAHKRSEQTLAITIEHAIIHYQKNLVPSQDIALNSASTPR